MNVDISKFVFLVLMFGWVGYRDILDTFEPIGTIMLFSLMFVLWLFRKNIGNSDGIMYFGTPMLLAGIALASVNMAAGVYLNGAVNLAAGKTVAEIYSYQKRHGQFPDDLSGIVSPEDSQPGRPGKLKYGSSFYYMKEAEQFSFGYRLFGSAGKFWDVKRRDFVASFD